ncbi:hypothetical protein OOU_Y34scaffold00485g13 [Pyricularia oryzae Y34]|uniref:Uncharacterized protein n=1 Tax=Pyricularia oryzae (strain Y34) TaxID=1143189 RepID=A0AA97PM87_PYRO3|nr:hypothetical protein OOU_Y34scaffold00485g13 [Pyricularia oryzae Y34]
MCRRSGVEGVKTSVLLGWRWLWDNCPVSCLVWSICGYGGALLKVRRRLHNTTKTKYPSSVRAWAESTISFVGGDDLVWGHRLVFFWACRRVATNDTA